MSDGEPTFSVEFATERDYIWYYRWGYYGANININSRCKWSEHDMYVTASNPTRASVTDTVTITVFGRNDIRAISNMEPLTMIEDTPYAFMSMGTKPI